LRVDYGEVASRYDANAVRSWIERDPRIAALGDGDAAVLDLACGTGTWLAAQQGFFPSPRLRWHGLDASAAMLDRARVKAPHAELRVGAAERLPYADGAFDYVSCRFAFHHFEDKAGTLVEMRRVLRPGGSLVITNLVPERSPDWWLYRFFPAAVALDLRRFWPLVEIERALGELGFATRSELREIHEIPWALLYTEAHNRETSQLVLLDDASYAAGCAALRDAMPPNPRATVDCALTLVDLVAHRPQSA
jgi:ubiquinone/menaquinone biosynthesis C-methylase UbiE